MASAAAFSRLQLVAALLEYDNDLPDAPKRSAHESAIFSNFRRNPTNVPPGASRKSDYLGVSLAGDDGRSVLDNRQSKASAISINTLQNPFGPDDQLEEDDEDEEGALEVDLASWGLDAFIPKDKASKNSKGKAKSTDIISPHSVSSVPSHQPFTSRDAIATAPRRALGASRSMSVGGNLEYFGTEFGTEKAGRISSLPMDSRRRSIGSPMDASEVENPIIQRRRASSYTLLSTSTSSPYSGIQSVPFPTTSVRSASPNLNEDAGLDRMVASSFAGRSDRQQALSSGSTDPKPYLDDGGPSINTRQRSMSNATMATILLADDNPFALRPPSRASRFDPKAAAHARTVSNASMGSRMLLDNDGMSVRTALIPPERERRYSTTLDLLRPKILVMPSPLQPVPVPTSTSGDGVRDGFLLSTDGPPLPPGARSARRTSAIFSNLETPPLASNSFTPNPLNALSLSQMTFRNTLKTGGERVSYMEGNLPRATEDGEQANFDGDLEEPQMPTLPEQEDAFKTGRPAGKLFGKSLIDDLENRKAQMRSKQRVFTGDERPSMMARGSQQRTSTFIDPAALQPRPTSQHLGSYGSQGSQQALGRRNSANAKPLLNFDEDDKIPSANTPGARIPSGRSVFGVDTLWEREMIKLREIEAREKVEEERKRKEEPEDISKKKKKGRRKDKSNATPAPEPDHLVAQPTPETRVSADPPTLPDIQRASRKAPPQIPGDESESGSDDAGPSKPARQSSDPNWHAVSSDEDEGDGGVRRTTGTGLRVVSKNGSRRAGPTGNHSEDDLPLSTAINRVGKQTALLRPGDDSEDERPLSTLLQRKQSNLPVVNFDNLLGRSPGNADDDDQPLGLRVSRVAPSSHAYSQAGGDDDDRPLAYHPEQQRRTQAQIIGQQQHQLMQAQMQAQMHNSMYFSPPSMIGSPFFGPPMMPMMMQTPIPVPSGSPPPMHDEAKYGRVDRWRRDVAVEGEP